MSINLNVNVSNSKPCKSFFNYFNIALSRQVLDLKLQIDVLHSENHELQTSNNTLRKVNDKYRDNEYYMQQKYEEMRQKMNAKDSLIRQKDEIIFEVSREVETLKADIRNMETIEEALKAEIDDLVIKRKSFEDINQHLKNQICEQNIETRKIDSINNSLTRENHNLVNNIEMFKKNTEGLIEENNKLRDDLDALEERTADQTLLIQNLQTENQMLRADNQRVRRNRTASREAERNEYLQRSPQVPQNSSQPHMREPDSPVSTKNTVQVDSYQKYLNKMQSVNPPEQQRNSEFNIKSLITNKNFGFGARKFTMDESANIAYKILESGRDLKPNTITIPSDDNLLRNSMHLRRDQHESKILNLVRKSEDRYHKTPEHNFSNQTSNAPPKAFDYMTPEKRSEKSESGPYPNGKYSVAP